MIIIFEKQGGNMLTEKRQTVQKHSDKRDAILQNMRSRKDHPTADMVYASIREEYPEISLATVYRNLAALCDSGDIIALGAKGKERYDGNVNYHNHFSCTQCGAVEDIMSHVEITGLDQVEDEIDGKITSASIVFRGICGKCLDKIKK